MFDGVLNMQINTAAKPFSNNYWWTLEGIEIKGCIGIKCLMSGWNIHVCIAIVNNKFDCVLLIRTLKQNFCITGNVLYLSNNSHHTVTFFLLQLSSSFS